MISFYQNICQPLAIHPEKKKGKYAIGSQVVSLFGLNQIMYPIQIECKTLNRDVILPSVCNLTKAFALQKVGMKYIFGWTNN